MMKTYKEFLKTLDTDSGVMTEDEVGLILYYKESVLSVRDDDNWTIPKDQMKILETKEQGAVRLFKQVFDLDVDINKFNLISAKFNSNRGKLYLYTYKCKSNYRTNGFVTETYSDWEWVTVNNLPNPFCSDMRDYI